MECYEELGRFSQLDNTARNGMILQSLRMLIPLVAVLTITGCAKRAAENIRDSHRPTRDAKRVETTAMSAEQADLVIRITKIESSVYVYPDKTREECYVITAHFSVNSSSSARLPVDRWCLKTSPILEEFFDYDIKRDGKWVSYWDWGMRSYYPGFADDQIVVSRTTPVTLKVRLPFRRRDGDSISARIRVGGAVSDEFSIKWGAQ